MMLIYPNLIILVYAPNYSVKNDIRNKNYRSRMQFTLNNKAISVLSKNAKATLLPADVHSLTHWPFSKKDFFQKILQS